MSLIKRRIRYSLEDGALMYNGIVFDQILMVGSHDSRFAVTHFIIQREQEFYDSAISNVDIIEPYLIDHIY